MKYLSISLLFILNTVCAQTPKQIKICIDTCKTLPSLDKYWNTLDYSQRSNPVISQYFQKKYQQLPRDSSSYTTYKTDDNLQDSVKTNTAKHNTYNINLAGTHLKKVTYSVLEGTVISVLGITLIFILPEAFYLGYIISVGGSIYTGISTLIHIYNAGELLERHY